MKKLIQILILILLFKLDVNAQEKSIISYSFQENSIAVSKSPDVKINMLIGKTVVGVSVSDKIIIKGSSFINLNSRGNNNTTAVENKEAPRNYSLEQNFPNPFNPVTRIQYSILKEGYVSLVIYNMLGEKVQQLVDELKSPGTYVVDWDAKDFTSGIYVYSIKSGNFSDSKKLVLLR